MELVALAVWGLVCLTALFRNTGEDWRDALKVAVAIVLGCVVLGYALLRATGAI